MIAHDVIDSSPPRHSSQILLGECPGRDNPVPCGHSVEFRRFVGWRLPTSLRMREPHSLRQQQWRTTLFQSSVQSMSSLADCGIYKRSWPGLICQVSFSTAYSGEMAVVRTTCFARPVLVAPAAPVHCTVTVTAFSFSRVFNVPTGAVTAMIPRTFTNPDA